MNPADEKIAQAQQEVRYYRAFLQANPGFPEQAEHYYERARSGEFVTLPPKEADRLHRYHRLMRQAADAQHTLDLYGKSA